MLATELLRERLLHAETDLHSMRTAAAQAAEASKDACIELQVATRPWLSLRRVVQHVTLQV